MAHHMTESVLRRSDWSVTPIPMGEGKRLVRALHYSKSHSNTATYLHGLRQSGILSDVYGVAWWIPPTRTTAEALAGDEWRGVLSLSRLVVAPEVPKNGASFLLGRSMRMVDRDRWPTLVTYADTRLGHTGAIYRATNWREDGPVAAGDVWLSPDGEQRGRKRGRFTYTSEQMRERGFSRVPPAPKIRFVHHVSRLGPPNRV
jgi:hypothetical protein